MKVWKNTRRGDELYFERLKLFSERERERSNFILVSLTK
jgi:hypothetical protein